MLGHSELAEVLLDAKANVYVTDQVRPAGRQRDRWVRSGVFAGKYEKGRMKGREEQISPDICPVLI